MCGCGEQRDVCLDCNKGYLTLTLAGQPPIFKKIELKHVKIAVCRCGGHHETCSECNEGFLEQVKNGKAPHFKVIYEDDADFEKYAKESKDTPKDAPAGLLYSLRLVAFYVTQCYANVF